MTLTWAHLPFLKGFRYQYSLQLESYTTLRVDTSWDMNYCPVWILVTWQTDGQTDRQKVTHMSLPCNMHRWAQKSVPLKNGFCENNEKVPKNHAELKADRPLLWYHLHKSPKDLGPFQPFPHRCPLKYHFLRMWNLWQNNS